MTEPTTSQTVSEEQIQPIPSQNIDIPVPAQIPTGSFSLLDENEISDVKITKNLLGILTKRFPLLTLCLWSKLMKTRIFKK